MQEGTSIKGFFPFPCVWPYLAAGDPHCSHSKGGNYGQGKT